MNMNTESSPQECGRRALKDALCDGYAALESGDFEKARRHFSRASELDANTALPGILNATLLLTRRDTRGYLQAMRRVVRRFPECGLCRTHLAEAYFLVGRRADANRQLAIVDDLDVDSEVREFASLLSACVQDQAPPAQTHEGS